MKRDTRPISWIRATLKVYERFPMTVQNRSNTALIIAAEGGKADIAKPLKGLGSGIVQIAVRYRTDAYRVVYAVEIAGALWVIHAFQKKSRIGVRTPKAEIDLIRKRLRFLKEKELSQ